MVQVQTEDRFRVPHRESVVNQQVLNLSGQFQQTNRIGNRGALFPGLTRDLFMRQTEFATQPLVGGRKFDGVQVFALYVLDQRDGEELLLSDVLYDNGALFQSRELRRAPTAFAGDQLILVPRLSDD